MEARPAADVVVIVGSGRTAFVAVARVVSTAAAAAASHSVAVIFVAVPLVALVDEAIAVPAFSTASHGVYRDSTREGPSGREEGSRRDAAQEGISRLCIQERSRIRAVGAAKNSARRGRDTRWGRNRLRWWVDEDADDVAAAPLQSTKSRVSGPVVAFQVYFQAL